jgi:hypothetical protein
MDDEWDIPAPLEDPEVRGTRLVRNAEGEARLVPTGNVVEGEFDAQAAEKESGCPFSGAGPA